MGDLNIGKIEELVSLCACPIIIVFADVIIRQTAFQRLPVTSKIIVKREIVQW